MNGVVVAALRCDVARSAAKYVPGVVYVKVALTSTVDLGAPNGAAVKLRVESADNEIDASELERWRRRAQALHGELRHWAGGVELILPTVTGNEGRHDDGLDL